jgi:hypothetical protein
MIMSYKLLPGTPRELLFYIPCKPRTGRYCKVVAEEDGVRMGA